MTISEALLCGYITAHPRGGVIRLETGHLELTRAVLCPGRDAYTCRHYNEIGKYTMLQHIVRSVGENGYTFSGYQERYK